MRACRLLRLLSTTQPLQWLQCLLKRKITPTSAAVPGLCWALKLIQPVLSPAAMEGSLTNEGGAGGKIRLLKNIMGLWLLQQSRRRWQLEGENYSYAELTELAEQAPAFSSLIDPDAPEFLNPPSMPDAICQFCRETGQYVPQSKGESQGQF